MSASQPALFNVQEFTDDGITLVGGRLYTYIYGTTALKVAYTDPEGLVPHTYTTDGLGGQYIALNVRGELPAPLYLASGSYYIALKRADGSTVWTRRADPTGDGIAVLATPNGASLLGVAPLENLPSIATVLTGTVQAVFQGIVKRTAWLFSPLWTDFRQVDAPVGSAVLTAGVTGSLTGTYEYAITYVTADGETECGGASAPLNVAGKKIILSAIPVATDTTVIARRIYRTTGASSDVVIKYLVAEIPADSTTTYSDNAPDGTLVIPVPRINTTGGLIKQNGTRIGVSGTTTTVFGFGAHQRNAGYANSAFGTYAMAANTIGYRCTGVGIYALTSNTTGFENTAIGVHSGNNNTTGWGNTHVGYSAGYSNVSGVSNTNVGDFAGFIGVGSYSTLIGAYALQQNLGRH